MSSPSSRTVERVESDTVTDLSGYWNDVDVRLVADSLVEDCLNSPAINGFIDRTKKLPVVIVGSFKNQSDEHIDTSILVKKIETALVNSGKVEFVAASEEREALRDEREDQLEWASEDSAKRLANETASDYMLVGSIKTIVDQISGKTVRTYMVYAELVDVETTRKVWIGENDEIKKIITRSKSRF
jgi:hypothetical protein